MRSHGVCMSRLHEQFTGILWEKRQARYRSIRLIGGERLGRQDAGAACILVTILSAHLGNGFRKRASQAGNRWPSSTCREIAETMAVAVQASGRKHRLIMPGRIWYPKRQLLRVRRTWIG
jgi:hypothetical protein